MEYIDITGKLNTHEEYIKLIKQLENRTKYIEVVLLNDDEDELVNKLKKDIIEIKKVNKWWGTKSSSKYNMYKIKSTPKLFKLLKEYTTFCIFKTDLNYGDYVEETEFGIKDIAFFDDKREPLFYTTTHEGYLELRKDLK